MRQLRSSLRFATGCALLLYYLVISSRAEVDRSVSQLRQFTLGQSYLTRLDRRCQRLTAGLPKRIVLGWITDAPEQVPRRFEVQYALAPRLLEPGLERELIVGQFDGDPDALLARHQLRVVKRIRGGLYLLSR